jgi:alkylhydroperoxidase family enzyme
MSFIGYISYDDASDDLKKLYQRFGGADKTPANVVRIAGHNPKAMENHVIFYRSIMFQDSPITRHQREMIAVVVSALNECHY